MADTLKKDILQIEKDCTNKAKKPKQELLKAYKQALDDIQNEIAGITQKYEIDGVLNISSKQRYSELKSLQDKLVKQANKLGALNIKQTSDLLSDIYSDSYYKTAYMIDKGISTNIDFSILRPEMVEAAINTPIDNITFSDRIWNNQKSLTNHLYNDVRKALVNGKSPEKLARQIKKDYGVTAYQASRLINTEVARAMSMAQDEIYQNSDVVQKVMWDATLEGNTCEICASLDGQYFLKDNHPDLPRHPMCRCCIIPVVDGWKPTRKLENIKNPETGEKTIIDYSTFDKWKTSKGI
ncbi:MAG: phage head morphogenesis protein [Oscillospiraceae bacterium]|jgi:SPP1 gp7 family putative phage head morphogenesis protein|nr:phage head morphogenesis protein [Oscillospiraceae bacterium]